MLSFVEQVEGSDIYGIAWNKATLLKVSLFVWRLLRNHIPMKDDSLLHGIIPSNVILCLSGCENEENIDHRLWVVGFMVSFGLSFTNG